MYLRQFCQIINSISGPLPRFFMIAFIKKSISCSYQHFICTKLRRSPYIVFKEFQTSSSCSLWWCCEIHRIYTLFRSKAHQLQSPAFDLMAYLFHFLISHVFYIKKRHSSPQFYIRYPITDRIVQKFIQRKISILDIHHRKLWFLDCYHIFSHFIRSTELTKVRS